MSETEEREIPKEWKKSVRLEVLAFRDNDEYAPKDKLVRQFFEGTIDFSVYNVDLYADTYLSILHTNRPQVGKMTRVFVHTVYPQVERGSSTFELTNFDNSEENGIVVRVGKFTPIDGETARTLLRAGKHKLLRYSGNTLILPKVYDESASKI
jgi:hypothetical protein